MSLWILAMISILLLSMAGVAFITLLERKVLGLTQVRLGPNKITLSGVLQPLADGLKLLSKQVSRTSLSQLIFFSLSPALLLLLFMMMWVMIIPWMGNFFQMKHNMLLFFSLLGVSAYSVILTGLGASSSFSKLGGMRGILQSLSYEVTFILLFLSTLISNNSMNILKLMYPLEIVLLWMVLWLILILLESNRAPFDLLEGESELISGFNIEMGSLTFVFLFLSEYGMIILMGLITSFIISGSLNLLLSILLMVSILMIRSCFPRFKYDSLMSLMWQIILPFSTILAYLVFF